MPAPDQETAAQPVATVEGGAQNGAANDADTSDSPNIKASPASNQTETSKSGAKHPVLCFSCNKTASKRCAVCKNARYCSETCQKKDWATHKLLCESFSTLGERPGPNHRRAILFPEHEDKPRFVWVEQTGNEYYMFDRKAYLGNVNSRTLDFDRYRPLRRLLGLNIAIWYDENFLVNGSPINKSLEKSLGPKISPAWRGPFLAQGYDGDIFPMDEQPRESFDLDTSAIGPIIDFLKFHTRYGMYGYEANWDVEE